MLKESKNLDLKKEMTDTFLKTVSAFANFGTGTIIFGVDDDGTIVGIDDMKKTRLDIENKINQNINPIPDYTLEEDEKNNIVKLVVKEGKDKPYFYKSKTYMRRDTSTVEMDKYELKRFIMDVDNISLDSLKSSNQDLEFRVLEKALKEKMGIEIFSLDTMRTLELYTKDYGYNKGAELLADTNKYEGIDIVRFGENISIFLDRVRLNRISIIEQYNKAVEKFVQYYTYEEVEGFYRVKKEKIPEDAFREAIANALINRDWDSVANIQVSFFDDRIEITSPGGLPKGVTIEDYLHKELSIPKNPIIANVFYRMGLIERYGTGVQRICALYDNNENKPIFNVSENLIKITLPLLGSTTPMTTPNTTPKLPPNYPQTTPKNDNEVDTNSVKDRIIKAIKNNKNITKEELAVKIGITKDGIKYHIKKLSDEGIISYIGTSRNGYWKILKDN